jgi:menaquinone-dependent protoporphyrinogen oxidase
MMKPILVAYATREGQTRHIAEHVASTLNTRRHPFLLLDAAHAPNGFTLTNFSAAIVAASLHLGKHEPEAVRFVKRHLAELRQIPTLFLSVSLSEAGIEDVNAPPERRAKAQADVKRTIGEFLGTTGWQPSHVAAVAGALRFTRYDFVTRFVMKRIAGKVGMPVDTTRDYEFTDWATLDQLIEDSILSCVSSPECA